MTDNGGALGGYCYRIVISICVLIRSSRREERERNPNGQTVMGTEFLVTYYVCRKMYEKGMHAPADLFHPWVKDTYCLWL